MITELTVECVDGIFLRGKCVKVIEFDMNDSLEVLHRCILASVKFEDDHLSQFFVGKAPSPYRENIAVYEAESDGFYEEDIPSGGYDTTLAEIYPLSSGYNLYYHFDFGDDWVFSIKKSRKKLCSPEPGIKYPRVIAELGNNPEQYPNLEDW